MASPTASRGARRATGSNVYDAAVDRLARLYDDGHRLIVSVSGGKDSGACLEVAVAAATLAGRLPVEALNRDEEILYPGSFDYLDRLAARADVDLTRVLVQRPIVNIFNRASPYYWPFDDRLPPSSWLRPPPADAVDLGVLPQAFAQVTPARYPPPPGKDLYVVLGLRVSESRGRMYGLFSSGGYTTKPNDLNVRSARPIYDWSDGDVWLAHKRFGWDFNSAYSDLARLGVPRTKLRVAPPALNAASATLLPVAARAWPDWFNLAAARLPGLREGAMFGRSAVTPRRRSDETWEETFKRECLGPDVPEWIRERAAAWSAKMTSHHRHHSTPDTPFPDQLPCRTCDGSQGSWRTLAMSLWSGDPTSAHARGLPEVPPSFFRPDAPAWSGIKERW